MSVNQLAGSDVYGPQSTDQIFAGDAPITSDAAVALADIDQYELCALTTTGVTPYLVGTHTADQAVIAAETAASGKQCPFWNGGYFNHALIIWPAGATLDTYAERKAFLANATIKIGHITQSIDNG